MAWRKRLAVYGRRVSGTGARGKDTRNHPSNAPVSDILVLQLGPPCEVIHANKQFGTLLEAHDAAETWSYPELMMTVDAPSYTWTPNRPQSGSFRATTARST